jgi:hypothetical protein
VAQRFSRQTAIEAPGWLDSERAIPHADPDFVAGSA